MFQRPTPPWNCVLSIQDNTDRLISLLEKTNDDKEKINLLREIQRLNEQIDRMEAQMQGLKNLADFSSISVELSSKKS